MENELEPIRNPFGFDGIHEPQSDTEDCCTHCGKPIENPARSAWVHVIDGGASLAPASWQDNDDRINPGGNMNWFQIGSVCKLKVPESYRSTGHPNKEERKQEGHRLDFQVSLPPVDSLCRVRFRALGIIRNANRAAQQAAMTLAFLDGNNEESDQLAREGLKAALDYLDTALNYGTKKENN